MSNFRRYYITDESEDEINDLFINAEVVKWEISSDRNKDPIILIQYEDPNENVKPKVGSDEERQKIKTDLQEEIDGLETQLANLKAEIKITEESMPEPEPEPEPEPSQSFTTPVKPLCSFCNVELPWKRNKEEFDFHKNGACIELGKA